MTRKQDGAGRPRRALVGPILVALLVVAPAGLVARADPPTDSPGPPSAEGVTPVIVDTPSSNDDCGDLGFDHTLSIAGNGQTSSGDLTVTVSGYNSPTGFVDWSSNLPIHGVYVKGGPSGGNLFSYPSGDTGDQDLHTPQKADASYYGVSHLAFCWNDVPTSPDVTIVKEHEPAAAVASGDQITYTLTVTNEGDGDATGVEVRDELPEGVMFVSATAGCHEASGVVTCGLGEIGSGASLSIEIIVQVDEAFCGDLVNTAHISAVNEDGDAQAANNDSNDVTNPVACDEPTPPDLTVTKTSDAGGVQTEGDDFTYTITVTNTGDEAATGVELVDVLPAGGAASVAIPPFPSFGGEPCVITSSVLPGGEPHSEVSCGPITLAPGASASVTIRVIVTGDVCGPITNVVDVEGANEPTEHVGPDNHAQVTDDVACAPRIRVTKGGPALAHVGDPVTYVFAVRNTGGVDLTNVQLSDPRCDGPVGKTADGDGDDVLAVDEVWHYECVHAITAADGDPVHNVATASGDHDGGTVTDTDAHDVDVIHPSIDLEKTADPTSGTAGTVITYSYVVTNTGDTTLFDISVDDDKVGHVGDISSLAPNASATLTSQITLGPSPITNVADAIGADVLGAHVGDKDSATVGAVAGGGGAGGTGGSPFTGSGADALGAWALVLASVGSALLASTRRRPAAKR